MAKKSAQLKLSAGLMLVLTYVVTLAVSALVVYLANQFFPEHVVLGTVILSPAFALFLSMGKLAFLDTFAVPFIHHWEAANKKVLPPSGWMALFFVINLVGLWGITRYSHIFGLGVTSWVVVVALAAVLDVAQGMAMMAVEKYRAK